MKYLLNLFLVFYAFMPVFAGGEDSPKPGDKDFIGPLSTEQVDELERKQ